MKSIAVTNRFVFAATAAIGSCVALIWQCFIRAENPNPSESIPPVVDSGDRERKGLTPVPEVSSNRRNQIPFGSDSGQLADDDPLAGADVKELDSTRKHPFSGMPDHTNVRFLEGFGGWYDDLLQMSQNDQERVGQAFARLDGMPGCALDLALSENPSLAFLFCRSANPKRCAELWYDATASERICLENLLQVYLDHDCCDFLMEAWKKHKKSVCRFWSKGLLGADAIYIFPRNAFTKEYDAWLTEVFEAPGLSSKQLADRLCFVLIQGSFLRHRLEHDKDETFRRTFREHWKTLEALTALTQRPIQLFVDQPEIWELLSLEHGAELARIYGVLHATLFMGKNAYPDDLKPAIIRLLLRKRRIVIEFLAGGQLHEGQDFLLFQRFLRENILRDSALGENRLSDEEMCIALQTLRDQGPDYPTLLKEYLALKRDELKKRLAAPIDLELWDDGLPSYLKAFKRTVCFQPWDPGDSERLIVDTGIDSLRAGLAIVSEGASEGIGIGYATDAAKLILHEVIAAESAQQLEKYVTQRIAASQGIDVNKIASMESRQIRPWFDSQAIESLLSQGRRGRPVQLNWTSFRFFHERVSQCRAQLAMHSSICGLQLSKNGRAFIIRKSDQDDLLPTLGSDDSHVSGLVTASWQNALLSH